MIKNPYLAVAENEDLPQYIRIPFLTASHVVFQGLGYMDTTERIYKISQNFLMTVLLTKYTTVPSVKLAAAIGHFFGFVCNGQFPVVLKNLDLVHTAPYKFEYWQHYLSEIGENSSSISAIGVYGSLSRDELGENSDLDVRLVRRSGFLSGLQSCVITNALRFTATLTLFPLDIYVVDSTDMLDRLREDEDVQILVDKDNVFHG